MMKKLVFLITALSVAFIVSAAAPQTAQSAIWGTPVTDPALWNDSRSSGNGITGTGDWTSGFNLSWQISKNSGVWTYEYTVSTDNKDISHFILEVTDDEYGFSILNGSSSGIDSEAPKTYESGGGNPGMPNPFYGIKFDFGAAGGAITYTLVTDRSPVYGVFYAKDGKTGGVDNIAHSNALSYSDFRTNDGLVALDFIVRPNGAPVPVPGAVWLLGSGIAGLICLRRRP
jgi:hypothetical protein